MKCLVIFFVLITILRPLKCEDNKDSMVAYIKGSLPNQIYRCIQRFNLLRCLKYFVLLRLEARDYPFPDTANMTLDFFGNLLASERNLPKEIPENVVKLSDDELNRRLTAGVQTLFKDRPIKLHFIPNMLVKLVPSNSNDLEVSLKKIAIESFSSRQLKSETDESGEVTDKDTKDDMKTADDESEKGSGIRKKGGYYLQLGLPLVLAPYMVFAGFLPMLIPVLKLATAFTSIVNVTALIASVMYLARQHAIEKEMQQTVYFNPGYKDHHH